MIYDHQPRRASGSSLCVTSRCIPKRPIPNARLKCPKLFPFFPIQTPTPAYSHLELRCKISRNLISQRHCVLAIFRAKNVLLEEDEKDVVDLPGVVLAAEEYLVVTGAVLVPLNEYKHRVVSQHRLVSANEGLGLAVVQVLKGSDDTLVRKSDCKEEFWNPFTGRHVLSLHESLEHGDERCR
jgi:hypothetical protein